MARQDDAVRASRSPIGLAIAAVIAMAAALAWVRGGWLDEFWTVWHSDPAVPFARAFGERWLRDTQHPPTFYALAWAVGHVTGPSLALRRLAMDGLGLLLLVPSLAIARRGGRVPLAALLLVLLVLSGPYAVTYFAEHRSYALGLCAATALVLSLRTLHLAGMAREPLGAARAGWFVAITLFACSLHYTLALILFTLLGGACLLHWWRGSRPLAGLIAAAALLAAAALAATLAAAVRLQAPIVAVHVGLAQGWATVAAMIALGLGTNVVLLARAAPEAARLLRDRAILADPRASFVALLAATLLVDALLFALLEIVTRNMYPRLLLGLLPVAGGIVAELAGWRPIGGALCVAAAANALLVALATTVWQGRNARIDHFGPAIAAAVRACPTTRVLALDPMAMLPADDPLRRMAGQREAVALGYRATAARWGFPVRLLPEEGPPPGPDPRCPTLVWLEHGFMLPGQGAAQLAARAGLRPAPGTRQRLDHWQWHYLLRVEPPR